MDENLNCFQWRRYLSDLLDVASLGEPSADLHRPSFEHLKKCASCNASFERYQQVVSLIHSQPKAKVPEGLKKAPLSATLPQVTASQFSLSQWEKLPWYLRTSLETVAVIALVLSGISSAPKLRNWYERAFENKLGESRDSFSSVESSKEFAQSNIPSLGDAPQAPSTAPSGVALVGVTDEDEISGENEASEDYSSVGGKSQLWRFTLKTVSPDELRQQIIHTLLSLKVSDKTPGLSGMQVPGGIEFKMILQESQVPDIKSALQKLAPILPEKSKSVPGSENFTWYRVKSRKKIPEGKAQVIIWLSQPN